MIPKVLLFARVLVSPAYDPVLQQLQFVPLYPASVESSTHFFHEVWPSSVSTEITLWINQNLRRTPWIKREKLTSPSTYSFREMVTKKLNHFLQECLISNKIFYAPDFWCIFKELWVTLSMLRKRHNKINYCNKREVFLDFSQSFLQIRRNFISKGCNSCGCVCRHSKRWFTARSRIQRGHFHNETMWTDV